MRSTRSSLALVLGALCSFSACGGVAEEPLSSDPGMRATEETAESAVGSTEQSLFREKNVDRYNWWAPSHEVRVCWDAATMTRSDFNSYRNSLRELIMESYGRYVDLRFTGWGSCNDVAKPRIVIKVDDQGGAQTTYPDGQAVVALSPSYWAGMRAAIMHEFGHALGFQHEFDRTDRPAYDCTEPTVPQPNDNRVDYTPYDHDSILNSTYCGAWETLSRWDIVGLQRVFGRKPHGSVVGQMGYCLDIHNPNVGTAPTSATKIQTWECLGNSNQHYQWMQMWQPGSPSTRPGYASLYAHMYYGAGNFAFVDVPYSNTANGTELWNWLGNATEAQTWSLENQNIVGMGNLCLRAAGGNASAGAQVALGWCSESYSRWDLRNVNAGNSSKLLVLRGTNLCVQAEGTVGAYLRTCDTNNTAQQFLMDHGYFRSNLNDNTCLDVSYADPSPGRIVGRWECHADNDNNRFAQYFFTRGPIRGIADKCIDVHNINIGNGSKVQLWDCHGGANQTWEWWF